MLQCYNDIVVFNQYIIGMYYSKVRGILLVASERSLANVKVDAFLLFCWKHNWYDVNCGCFICLLELLLLLMLKRDVEKK